MPRGIPNKPKSKKTTKKTAARYLIDRVNVGRVARGAKPIPTTRKPKVTLDNVVAAAREAGAQVEVAIDTSPNIGTSAYEEVAADLRNLTSDYSITSNLARRLKFVEISPVDAARTQLLGCVRTLVEAEVALATMARNESVFHARTAAAKVHLAGAELDEAISVFEKTIRG